MMKMWFNKEKEIYLTGKQSLHVSITISIITFLITWGLLINFVKLSDHIVIFILQNLVFSIIATWIAILIYYLMCILLQVKKKIKQERKYQRRILRREILSKFYLKKEKYSEIERLYVVTEKNFIEKMNDAIIENVKYRYFAKLEKSGVRLVVINWRSEIIYETYIWKIEDLKEFYNAFS